MEDIEKKLIGFKAYIKQDRLVNMRAMKMKKNKSQLYREIIDNYFKQYPITDAERSLL